MQLGLIPNDHQARVGGSQSQLELLFQLRLAKTYATRCKNRLRRYCKMKGLTFHRCSKDAFGGHLLRRYRVSLDHLKKIQKYLDFVTGVTLQRQATVPIPIKVEVTAAPPEPKAEEKHTLPDTGKVVIEELTANLKLALREISTLRGRVDGLVGENTNLILVIADQQRSLAESASDRAFRLNMLKQKTLEEKVEKLLKSKKNIDKEAILRLLKSQEANLSYEEEIKQLKIECKKSSEDAKILSERFDQKDEELKVLRLLPPGSLDTLELERKRTAAIKNLFNDYAICRLELDAIKADLKKARIPIIKWTGPDPLSNDGAEWRWARGKIPWILCPNCSSEL